MSTHKPRYHRHWFPPEIISYAIWLYHLFNLSFRDIEDLLAERGIKEAISQERCRSICGFDKRRKIEPAPVTPTGATSDMRPVK